MLQDNWFFKIAKRIRPELNKLEGNNLVGSFIETFLVTWITPFALIGLVWLTAVTDWTIIRQNPLPLLLLLAAMMITGRQTFSIYIELEGGMNVGPISSLGSLIGWSAVLIFGPTALWLLVMIAVIGNIRFSLRLRRYKLNSFWSPWSLFVQDVISVLISLISIQAYLAVGGTFPFEGLTVASWLPVLLATLLLAILPILFLLPPTLQLGRFMGHGGMPPGFLLGIVVFTLLPAPFAILAAILYAQVGWSAFFFFILGTMLVNYLAHHLSNAQQRSLRQSRALARLEALGESLLQGPADASELPSILESHLPLLFPQDRLEIRLFEEAGKQGLPVFHQVYPPHLEPVSDAVWERIRQSKEPWFIERGKDPADPADQYNQFIGVQISASEADGETAVPHTLGALFLRRHELSGPIDPALNTVQTLASQIGTTLYRALVHAETLAHQKVTQELAFAGRIQASFLPKSIPTLSGWQIAATIEPARQTSGDFYDFIPLSEGKLGILVADVADKGTGAALYMAMSRTLIRTYAMSHEDQPELALAQANERILADTESDQFVTVFYGILDWQNGRLTYANAGHNPAYLLSHNGPAETPQSLLRTGIPLGMFPDMAWEQKTVEINPGDLLFVYSDGVTEAQNSAGNLFDDHRLLAVGQSRNGRSADEIQTAVLEAIYDFVGDAPQFDDITLMVITRDEEE